MRNSFQHLFLEVCCISLLLVYCWDGTFYNPHIKNILSYKNNLCTSEKYHFSPLALEFEELVTVSSIVSIRRSY